MACAGKFFKFRLLSLKHSRHWQPAISDDERGGDAMKARRKITKPRKPVNGFAVMPISKISIGKRDAGDAKAPIKPGLFASASPSATETATGTTQK
jgi:hypothetical protein